MANSETSPKEVNPGEYDFEELQLFDHRQAWTTELAADGIKQAITVGPHETVWLSRAPEKARYNRAASELWAIQKLLQHGTFEAQKGKEHQIIEELPPTLEREGLLTPWVTLSLEELERAVVEARQRRAEERITRVAGYIAKRSNLWIVTKSEPKESKEARPPLIVGVARLVGITLDVSIPTNTYVRPVVKGKNEKIGRLGSRKPKQEKVFRPHVLDVIESSYA